MNKVLLVVRSVPSSWSTDSELCWSQWKSGSTVLEGLQTWQNDDRRWKQQDKIGDMELHFVTSTQAPWSLAGRWHKEQRDVVATTSARDQTNRAHSLLTEEASQKRVAVVQVIGSCRRSGLESVSPHTSKTDGRITAGRSEIGSRTKCELSPSANQPKWVFVFIMENKENNINRSWWHCAHQRESRIDRLNYLQPNSKPKQLLGPLEIVVAACSNSSSLVLYCAIPTILVFHTVTKQLYPS